MRYRLSGVAAGAVAAALLLTGCQQAQEAPLEGLAGAQAAAAEPTPPRPDAKAAKPAQSPGTSPEAAEPAAIAPPIQAAASEQAVETREVAKPVVSEYAANVPPVLLTAAHSKICKLMVGDVFPSIELPRVDGGPIKLERLTGKRATVVLFWTPDHWMSRAALADLAKDAAAYGKAGDVAVAGIAVGQAPDAVQAEVKKAGARFPLLHDANGEAFAQVGEALLPRIYVLDGQRRIAWFDIEYSEATRRELAQTVAALTAKP